jgi:hypothetical protein
VELTDLSPPSGSTLREKNKILLCGMGRRRRSFGSYPPKGVVLKTLILFVRFDGLEIHGIDVGRRPTADAGDSSGG